jgi:hypothetical protein
VGNHAVKRHLAFLTLAEDGTVVRRRFKLSKAPSTRCASGAGDSVGFDSKGNLWTAGQESLAVVHPGGNAELWCAADLIQHVRPSIPTVGPDGNFWFRSWMGLQRINVADPSPYRCLLTLARRQKAARRSIVRGALRCSGSVNAVISGEAFVSDAGGRWRYSLRSARIKLRAGREKSIKIRIVRPSGSIALRGLLSTRRRAALYPEATIAGPYGAKTSVKRTWEGWL